MKSKLKIIRTLFLVAVAAPFFAACSRYDYKTVEGDPMNTRIYTLDNGLKVYLSVNREEPRIQTYIAVRVGAKNDPAENTGLAHYFEHLMFKGTEQFGTQNYALEKPLLDSIEAKFEYYGTLEDEAERNAVYAEIDSLSYEASKIAIPNEYDKLMAAIGAKGTNAYTGYDMTVYTEDIPSNQVENWARIQADRFKHNVIRGFHTELETVYEEKNMSLTSDGRKVLEAVSSELFKNHPYGTQTVLGTQEHLKNPSITKIKEYYKNWYVPNNMAVCMSGDFDPDAVIATIDKYFGDMLPNDNLQRLQYRPEQPIESPVEREVYGLESEYVTLAWRFEGANSPQTDTLTILSDMLYNGYAGLVDVNLNQSQKTLGASVFPYMQADYTQLIVSADPKEGQTLDQVKDLLLEQIELLKKGEFDESLLQATINNYKKNEMRALESNAARADAFVEAFINDIPWNREVERLDRLAALTKEDIVSFANAHLNDNYVVVKKLKGEDTSVKKIAKPEITPIFTNRDTASLFLKEIQASAVTPIEPVFVDYEKDLQKLTSDKGLEILYKQNTANGLFTLVYYYEFGTNDDPMLELADAYSYYLGTSKYSAEQIKAKLYDLACNVNVMVGRDNIRVTISGLSENMAEAARLYEEMVADYQPDNQALENMKADYKKSRANAKLNQSANFSMLQNYLVYGSKNPANTTFSNAELDRVTSSELLGKFRMLGEYDHTVLYYGPESAEVLVDFINKEHKVADSLKKFADGKKFKAQQVKEDRVYIAPYDAKQIYMYSYSSTGEPYDLAKTPIIRMYNEYFGGGMNSIVFQEMREARGLAYTAQAYYGRSGDEKDDPYVFYSFIATQNDKMMDAVTAFDEIINNMPQSEAAFDIAKENIIATLRTQRITKMNVLWNFVAARKLGLSEDSRKIVYEQVQNLTLDDVVKFQQDVIKDRKYYIGILGDEKELDMKRLGDGSYGKVIRLSTEDIFGY